MAILITGGTGFLGVKLASTLVQEGRRVVLYDVVPRKERVRNMADKVEIVEGDLRIWPEVLNVVKDYNITDIFHFGALLTVRSEENPWDSFQTNVAGTVNILEAARLFKVNRVIFASSLATYSLGTGEVVTDETLQRPTTMYGIGKLYCELLGRFYRRKFGIDFRALRYCSMMGPGAEAKALSQYYTWMVENATLGKPFECFVTEDTTRPVIYYKDAVRAALMLYEAPKDKIDTVCYNISGVSPARTARELETIIRKYIPQAVITYRPDPAIMHARQNMNVTRIDDSQARSEWGWQPLFSDLEKIVVDFMQELRKYQ